MKPRGRPRGFFVSEGKGAVLDFSKMVEILERAEIRNQAVPLSVQAFHVLVEAGHVPKNTELIRGIIVEKMSKSPLHSFVVRKLYEILRAVCPSGCEVLKEDPLTLLDSEPEPDLAIVADGGEAYSESHPTSAELVVEVAISSIEIDLDKLAVYAEAEVPEVWLVKPELPEIEIYSSPEEGRYSTRDVFADGSIAKSPTVPGFEVAPESLVPKS